MKNFQRDNPGGGDEWSNNSSCKISSRETSFRGRNASLQHAAGALCAFGQDTRVGYFRRTGVLRQYETLETRGLRQSSHNEAGLVSLSHSAARRDKDGSR